MVRQRRPLDSRRQETEQGPPSLHHQSSFKETLEQHGLIPHRHVQLPALASKNFLNRLILKLNRFLNTIRPQGEDAVLFSKGPSILSDKLYRTWLRRLTCKVVTLTQLNTEIQAYNSRQVDAGSLFFSQAFANVFVVNATSTWREAVCSTLTTVT